MREGELFAQGATFLASRLGHARQHAIAVLAMAEGDALWAPQANEAMDLVRLLLDASPAVARPVSMLDACAPQEPGRKPSTRADGVRVPRGTTLTPWRERSRLQCSHAVDRTRSIPKPKAVRAVRQAILRPAVTGVMAVGIGMVAGVPATPIQVTTQYASCTVLGFPAQRVSKSFLKPRMALSAFFGSRGVEPIGLKDARLVLGGKRA